MKKLLLTTLICVSFLQANAQKAIKLNIFSPIVQTLNVSYEQALNKDKSFQLGFFYTGYSSGDTKFSGIGITPEYRIYLGEEVMNSFYVAPFVRFQNFTLKDKTNTTDEATLTTFGGGLIAGRQWIFKDKFTLDLFIGPSYNTGSTKVKSGTSDDYSVPGAFNGFGIRTGLTFGLKF